MTTKELAKDLKEHIGCGIEVPLYDDELEVVVEALEKQIAKKPKDITPHYMDSKVYECPICKEVYTYRDAMNNYCKYCGQKLDWSEYND